MKLAVGIDIGGTNTRVGSVDQDGNVLERSSFNTADYSDGDLYADALAAAVSDVMRRTESVATSDVEWLGVGMGAPNGNFRNGSVDNPPNLRFKGVTPLAAMLKSRLGLENVVLTNDANAAAIGEKVFGGAKDISDFIMITLGTGLGSGVFVDGHLVYGQNGCAGEVGHMTIIPDGRFCGYGRQGSLENYCSATGIRRTFFEMLADMGIPTLLDEVPLKEITSKMVVDCAVKGDNVALATVARTGELLGEALASVALVTGPEAFFLFGGPVKAGDLLLDPIRRSFEDHLIPTYKGQIKIIESELPMGDAAILGASALVIGEE